MAKARRLQRLEKTPILPCSACRTRPMEHEKLFVLPDYTGLEREIRPNGAEQRRADTRRLQRACR
jgi:hypothetical protein